MTGARITPASMSRGWRLSPIGAIDATLRGVSAAFGSGAPSSRLKVEGVRCLAAAHLVRRWSGEAKLSPFRFVRAFKAATAIAERVGYADQGALTRLFRNMRNTTPSRFRRERAL